MVAWKVKEKAVSSIIIAGACSATRKASTPRCLAAPIKPQHRHRANPLSPRIRMLAGRAISLCMSNVVADERIFHRRLAVSLWRARKGRLVLARQRLAAKPTSHSTVRHQGSEETNKLNDGSGRHKQGGMAAGNRSVCPLTISSTPAPVTR